MIFSYTVYISVAKPGNPTNLWGFIWKTFWNSQFKIKNVVNKK